MNNLRDELDKIALELAREVQRADCPLDSRLDAFKVLSAYHLGLMKKGQQPPNDANVKPFSSLIADIKKAG